MNYLLKLHDQNHHSFLIFQKVKKNLNFNIKLLEIQKQ